MKLFVVILAALVGLHAGAGVVQKFSPVMERSTVRGQPDRVRYVRHTQDGRVEAVGAVARHDTGRPKREPVLVDANEGGVAGPTTVVTGQTTGVVTEGTKLTSDTVGKVIGLTTTSTGGLPGRRRRSRNMDQLPKNVIHAPLPARVPVFEDRTRRSSPMDRRMRPN